ncbi:hypothetical protein EXIGLDRAFT_833267 [Exidia glandulosa HHB12029]|uniref:Actin-like ATPase domain-containing protein n=1 Tax=Exidia glandulosa HHB12029 TaxID=1314781 RepID=A0A165KT42_EXIGL|nr:hypothetical protein EXIGLDRAFT_833267 [Exidia glandulosa HHB12029]
MSEQPYNDVEKIVFAFDCGTTMTAISFAHLLPGQVPEVHFVNRWPSQEDAAGNCKVPTVVRYNASGTAVSFGAAAVDNDAAADEDDDDESETNLAYWFKLLLHPTEMRDANKLDVPPLPPNVTLRKVYADFLRFAFTHARDSFIRNNPDGAALWARLGNTFELVYAIPNGWGGTQQSFIREALVAANVFPATFSPNRLAFVSEAEASAHFALEHMGIAHWLKVGSVFAVLDAGGSTVDTTIYRCTAVAPKVRLEEVTSSECVQAGSVCVDIAFGGILHELLAGSRVGADEYYVGEMLKTFESKTKRKFTGQEDQAIIQFGPPSVNDKPRGIRMGRLTVATKDMQRAFDPSVSAIVESVQRAVKRARVSCDTFLLVGGFAESPYLRDALQRGLKMHGIQLVFSDEPTKKAAAEGACLWHVKSYVSARAARYTYGVRCAKIYNGLSPVHYERRHLTHVDAAGDVLLPGFLDVLNAVLDNDSSVSRAYCRVSPRQFTAKDLQDFEVEILYTSDQNPGHWADTIDGGCIPGLSVACKISANLSGLLDAKELRVTPNGRPYWQMSFMVEMFFGQTALKAGLVWEEKGVTKRGPVTIIANSVV